MIYVVRHGKTAWNALGKRQGHENISLSKEGINQAHILKEKLKDVKFDLVFSSPLDRAINTAKIITNNDIIIDQRLIERNNGKLEGLTKEEIKSLYASSSYNEEELGVESTENMQKRANSFMKEILQKYPHKNILIVSHGGIIINIRCFLEKEPEDINDYYLDNCEVYQYNNDIK